MAYVELAYQQAIMQTWRCHSCKRIIAKMVLSPGSIVEIKCKCNAVNTLQSSR